MNEERDFLLRHLRQAGINHGQFPSKELLEWMARPRNPLISCKDDLANVFIEAMLTGEPVNFIYVGGASPGAMRRVQVSLVFQHEPKGRIYVSGYCLERLANRVFALDLIMVIHARN